jgi:hypothetical protein
MKRKFSNRGIKNHEREDMKNKIELEKVDEIEIQRKGTIQDNEERKKRK